MDTMKTVVGQKMAIGVAAAKLLLLLLPLPLLPQLLLQLVHPLTLLPQLLLLLPLLLQMLPLLLLLLAATAAAAAAAIADAIAAATACDDTLVTTMGLWGLWWWPKQNCTNMAIRGFRLDKRRPAALRFHCPRGLSIPCRWHGRPWPPLASTASGF